MFLTVKDVMVKKVIAIESDQTVKNAAILMNKHRIGCCIVSKNDKIVGMLTERDILTRLVAVSGDPDKTVVSEIMSEPAIVVEPSLALDEAVKLMFEHRIKKLPVVKSSKNQRKLVGIVTLTDIARVHPQLIKTLKGLFEMIKENPPRSIDKVIGYYIV